MRRSSSRNNSSNLLTYSYIYFRIISQEYGERKTPRAGQAEAAAAAAAAEAAIAESSSSSSSSTVAAAVTPEAAEDAKSTSEHIYYTSVRRRHPHVPSISVQFLKTKKLHLRPWTSRLPHIRATELLVPGDTTPISTADPLRPLISRAGLTALL